MFNFDMVHPWLWLVTEGVSETNFYAFSLNIYNYSLFDTNLLTDNKYLYYSDLNIYYIFTNDIIISPIGGLLENFRMRTYFGDIINLYINIDERMIYTYEWWFFSNSFYPIHFVESSIGLPKRITEWIGIFRWLRDIDIVEVIPAWSPHFINTWTSLPLPRFNYDQLIYGNCNKFINITPYPMLPDYFWNDTELVAKLFEHGYTIPVSSRWFGQQYYSVFSKDIYVINPIYIKQISVPFSSKFIDDYDYFEVVETETHFIEYSAQLQRTSGSFTKDSLEYFYISSYFLRFIYRIHEYLSMFILDLNLYVWVNAENFVFSDSDESWNFGWLLIHKVNSILHMNEFNSLWQFLSSLVDFYLPYEVYFSRHLQDNIIKVDSGSLNWLYINFNPICGSFQLIISLIYYFIWIVSLITMILWISVKIYSNICFYMLKGWRRYKRSIKKLFYKSFLYRWLTSGQFRDRRLNAVRQYAVSETKEWIAFESDLPKEILDWKFNYMFSKKFNRDLWNSLLFRTRRFVFWQVINQLLYRRFVFYLYSSIMLIFYYIIRKIMCFWMQTGYFFFSTYIVYYFIYNIKINLKFDFYINLWIICVKIKNFLLQCFYLPYIFVSGYPLYFWYPSIPHYYKIELFEEYPVPHGWIFAKIFRYWKPLIAKNLMNNCNYSLNSLQYYFCIFITFIWIKLNKILNIIAYTWLSSLRIYLLYYVKLLDIRKIILFIILVYFLIITKYLLLLVVFTFLLLVIYNIIIQLFIFIQIFVVS